MMLEHKVTAQNEINVFVCSIYLDEEDKLRKKNHTNMEFSFLLGAKKMYFLRSTIRLVEYIQW